MPYIAQPRRQAMKINHSPAESPGELNYQITLLVVEYIRNKKMSYQTINDIVGALDGAKLEFYRRVAAPYENSKIATNGDVYDFV
jgi:hypothetical protein